MNKCLDMENYGLWVTMAHSLWVFHTDKMYFIVIDPNDMVRMCSAVAYKSQSHAGRVLAAVSDLITPNSWALAKERRS